MKRKGPIRRVAVALVIGFVTTVAIAWIGSIASPGVFWNGHVLWPSPRFKGQATFFERGERDALGRRITRISRDFYSPRSPADSLPTSLGTIRERGGERIVSPGFQLNEFVVESRGWPFPALLGGVRGGEFTFVDENGFLFESPRTAPAQTSPYEWHGAMPSEAQTHLYQSTHSASSPTSPSGPASSPTLSSSPPPGSASLCSCP